MFVDLSDILDMDIEDLKRALEKESVPLGKITFKDATEKLNENGVYIFGIVENRKWRPVYVGKASSRTFFERFAGHFDTRSSGTFNGFIKRLMKNMEFDELADSAKLMMSAGTVVVIRVDDGPESCKKIEAMLIYILRDEGIINRAGRKIHAAGMENLNAHIQAGVKHAKQNISD